MPSDGGILRRYVTMAWATGGATLRGTRTNCAGTAQAQAGGSSVTPAVYVELGVERLAARPDLRARASASVPRRACSMHSPGLG
jgi:hypothetical protein